MTRSGRGPAAVTKARSAGRGDESPKCGVGAGSGRGRGRFGAGSGPGRGSKMMVFDVILDDSIV